METRGSGKPAPRRAPGNRLLGSVLVAGLLATDAACGGKVSDAATGTPTGGVGGRAVNSVSAGGTGQDGVSTGGRSTGGVGTGGTPIGSGGVGTGGTHTGGTVCAVFSSDAEPPARVLFFAIDATGSMNDVPTSGSTNGQSKWAVLRSVWPQLIAGLPSSWAVGMMEWSCPGCPTTAYEPSTLVPIAPLDGTQVAALSTALTTTPLGGYTPTEAAYVYALTQVQNWNAPAGYAASPRYIVLVTDGVPTVNRDGVTLGGAPQNAITAQEYSHLIATVGAQTATTGVETFVVGVPGSEDPQGALYDPMYDLSLMAQAGGTAIANSTPVSGTSNGTVVDPRGTYCHYDLTQGDFATNVQQALKRIKAELTGCTYPFPQPPAGFVTVNTQAIRLIYKQGGTTDIVLAEAPQDDCAYGGQWYFSGSDANGLPTDINLCPDTCTTVRSDLDASVEVKATCIPLE
jgi:hypothetical protein